MQNLIKRANILQIQKNIQKIIPVVSQIHSVPQFLLSNNPKYTYQSNNNGSSSEGYDRVSSYENLISRISSSESISDILKVYTVNEQLLKNEHIVLCLRMMARLLKASQQSELEELVRDQRYLALTQKAVQGIDTLNEYETLDFLFWMRKFRVQKIDLNMNEEAKEKFYSKVREFLKSKSFNFRNLVNLYYDYSFINRNSNDVCYEILRELKSDRNLLTPFTVIQILQASSKKSTVKQTQELMLADYVARNFQNLLDEFDTDQKCVIFKYLSNLEMSFNPPKFRLPYVMYLLRNHLKDKLDQLSEASVINILTAYQDLPREFPVDLIEEIKEMVIVTIQHNSQNIKSFFLLDFIETIQKIKRRRLDEKQVEILAKEIQSRIMHDEFLQKPKSIDRIIGIYDNGLKHPALMEAIEEFAKSGEKKVFLSGLYEFLARRRERKCDIDEIISPLVENLNIQNLGIYPQVRLFLILSFLPNSDKYSTQIEQLRPIVNDVATNFEGRLINIFKSSTMFGTTRKQYLDIAIKSLQNWFANQNLQEIKYQEFSNFLRNLFLSTEVKEQRINWIEWFTANSDKIDQSATTKIIDVFFQLENYSIDHFLLFFHVLQLDGSKNVPLKKLLFVLKDNQNFIQNLLRYENLFKRFVQIVTNLVQNQPENIRIQYIYGFSTRVESFGHKSQNFSRFLKRAFDLYKGNENQDGSKQIEFLYALTLMSQNTLQQKHAIEIYNKNENTMGDILLRSKFFSYILLNSNSDFRDSKQQYIKDILQQLEEPMGTTHNQKVIQSLAIYLSYPPQYITENKDLLLKTMKDYIGNTNQTNFLALVNAFNPRYVNTNYDLYFPFIKEIINIYPQYRKRLQISDIVYILTRFVSINCKYPLIYNHILEDLGVHFNGLNAEQRIRCLESFSTLQIKQSDFFQKTLQKMQDSPQKYRGYLNNILNSLYKIGYDDQSSIPIIQSLCWQLRREDNIDEIFGYLRLLPTLKMENEAEEVEKWFGVLPEKRGESHDRYKNRGEIVIMAEYYAKTYPNKPEYVTKIRNFLSEDDATFAQTRANFFNPTNQTTENNGKLIAQYLKAMGLECKLFEEFEGLLVDIQIPSKKILIKIVQARDTNFDRSTYNGKLHTMKRIYETLNSEFKVVLINNIEFRACQDDLGRINLLVSEGIESDVKEYNLDQIDKSVGYNSNNNRSNNRQKEQNNNNNENNQSQETEDVEKEVKEQQQQEQQSETTTSTTNNTEKPV